MSASQGMAFGALLRRYREAAGLTQEELAERAGLSPGAIGMLERGDRRCAYPNTVQALTSALGLTKDEQAALLNTRRATSSVPIQSAPAAGRLPAPPTPPTPIVGLDQDLEVIGAVLRSGEVRLLTLTGPDGVGKTRLAVEVTREVGEDFPDGIVFVLLAPVGDPALVVPTVAHTLGLGQSGGWSLDEVLRTYLRDKHMLLLLDNIEHLLEAARVVANLLLSCPSLKVLTTSRAPLRIRGEREYPVGPLAIPDLDRIPSASELAQVASAALFVDRARAASPSFELTHANAAAVSSICRRLDGLPLALELAAVRARLLSPTELLARLDQALPLLTGGARDLPERQQTMRAAIEWSYDLLDPAAQALFRRLSVFAGGWTLDAAEAVCGRGKIHSEVLLDLLLLLVEQSLVVAEVSSVGETRYRMLEPVRQYARDLLAASDEARDVGQRHAALFLSLAERAEPEIAGQQQVEWCDRLEVEYDNLRAAIRWSLDVGDARRAVRFGWALRMFWVIHQRHQEGRRWMEQALMQGDLAVAARAEALYVLAVCVYGSGDNVRLMALAEEGTALYRQVGDKYREAITSALVGFAAVLLGDLDRADAILGEALAILRGFGDTYASAHVLSHRAVMPLKRGDHRLACQYAEGALALTRQTGDRLATCVSFLVLGQAAQAAGEKEEAARYFTDALTLAAEIVDRANSAYSLLGLANVAMARGQTERTACLLGAAEVLLELAGSPQYAFMPPHPLRDRASGVVREQVGERAWAVAWRQGRAMMLEEVVEFALSSEEASEPT